MSGGRVSRGSGDGDVPGVVNQTGEASGGAVLFQAGRDVGDVHGPVVAGNYNLVVDARHGSSVTVEVQRERPAPVRRERISVLPRRAGEPLGREADATTLAAAVAGGGLVRLCGPSGIGKSTLLRHLARVAESGPDGVVFLSAAHKQVADLAQEVFEACFDTHGYAPSRSDLRGLLTGLRITVYVDDADLTVDELREFTDLAPDATFVLAGRDGTPFEDSVVHHLGGLGEDMATRLLTRGLGRALRDGERATAAELWRASGGNPLLLLRAVGVAKSGRSALPAPGAVADLLVPLLDQLGEPATSALNLLATLEDAEVAPEHVGALTRGPDPAATCDRLTDLGLVVAGEHGYRCAAGVVPVLRRRGVAAFPVERLCGHFTRWTADPATTPAQVAAHSRAVEKAADLAMSSGLPELAVELGHAASPKLAHSLRFDAWGRTLGRGWSGARRAGDREAEAYFAHEEGIRCLVTGRRVMAAVLLGQAVLLWHTLGDHQGTTAATDAQQFLPQQQPFPEGDASQAVADHMAELAREPVAEPTTDVGFDAAEPGFEQPSADVPVSPEPTPAAELAGPELPGSQLSGSQPPGSPPPDVSAVAPPNVSAAMPPDAGLSVAAAPASVSGASAAATGATAAAAAQGGSLLAVILIGLAVLGAIVIAREGEEETGVAGTWRKGREHYKIVESGKGVYTIQGCGGVIRLSGTDKRASGTIPVYDVKDPSCTKVIGRNNVTITVSADGDTAQWVETTRLRRDEWVCYTCGTSTLVRVG